MTNEGTTGPDEPGAEEAIEDLEAPASSQSEVAGGAGCGDPSLVCFEKITCDVTSAACSKMSREVVVMEQ